VCNDLTEGSALHILRLHSFRPYDLSGVWRINLRSRMEFGVNTREDFYMYKEISCPNLIHKRM